MSYRDDREPLREEIRRLEQRLEEAGQQVAELRGEVSGSAVERASAVQPLSVERILPVAFTPPRAIAVERLLRARLPAGMVVERREADVVASAVGFSFVVEAQGEEQTKLRMLEDLRPFRLSLMLTAISVLLTTVVAGPLALTGRGASAAFAATAVLFALSAFPLGMWFAKRRRRQLGQVFEACSAVLRDPTLQAGTRVRVAVGSAGPAEQDEEQAALAEEASDTASARR